MAGRSLTAAFIIDKQSRASTASTLGRAVIGDALAGTPGAIAGAMTGKTKEMTTFRLEYNDGSSETQTVATGSTLYNRYIGYVGGPPKRKRETKAESIAGGIAGTIIGVLIAGVLGAFIWFIFSFLPRIF